MVTNIENAFKFVFRDKNWIIKILVGGLISIVPVLNFIVFGYILKVLKDAKEGREAALPEWGNWSQLFKEGFMVFVIGLIYGLMIFALWFLTTIISLIPLIGCLSILLFPVLIIAVVLLAPFINVGLCRYLDKGVLQEAFKLKDVFEEFKSKISDYLLVTLIYAGITLIASMAFCIAPFVYFWLWLISARMFGEIYGTKPTKISP